jgi:hypothetical protein
VARAPVPSGPLIETEGADVYPVPPDVIERPVTTPLATVAVAAAPEPPPPEIVTDGGLAYPEPPPPKVIEVTAPPPILVEPVALANAGGAMVTVGADT